MRNNVLCYITRPQPQLTLQALEQDQWVRLCSLSQQGVIDSWLYILELSCRKLYDQSDIGPPITASVSVSHNHQLVRVYGCKNVDLQWR